MKDPTPPIDLEQRLDAAVQDFYERRQRGEQIEYRAFLDEYAEVSTGLAEFLKIVGAVDHLVEPASSPGVAKPVPDAATDLQQELPKDIGDYELGEELGRGGMGVVYRARQRAANRDVALKLVLSGKFASPLELLRFQNEAQAAARLDHPHIVPIYDVGDRDGRPYFTMKLLDGGRLSERFAEVAHDPKTCAKIALAIAEAVEHAHARGVLHRDLKPANILFDQSGVPHVTDFGLAKCLDTQGELTETGAVMGTPKYMAPEQAAGDSKHVTTAADIYSVGAILYEMVTGQPPFDGGSAARIYELVLNTDPRPPRQLEPAVPVDLEVICLKCLQKRPADRYESAKALADDLQAFLDGRSIQARPLGRVARYWRWCRRNALAASLLALVVVLATCAAITITVFWLQAEDSNRKLHHQNEIGQVHVEELETRSRELDARNRELDAKNRELDARKRELQRDNLLQQQSALRLNPHKDGWSDEAWRLIEQAKEIHHDVDLRDRAAAALVGLDAKLTKEPELKRIVASAVLWSADDGSKLLLGGTNGTDGTDGTDAQPPQPARIWDRVTGTCQDSGLPGDGAIAWRSDGVGLQAVAENFRTVIVCEVGTRKVLGRFTQPGDVPDDSSSVVRPPVLTFSSDGLRLAFAAGRRDESQEVVVWDVSSGEAVWRSEHSVDRIEGGVTALALSPHGTVMAIGNDQGQIQIRSLPDGELLADLPLERTKVHALAFGRDARRTSQGKPIAEDNERLLLASGDAGGQIVIWDLAAKQPRTFCRGTLWDIYGLAFRPDGATLATGGRYFVKLWDIATGRLMLELRADDSVLGLDFDGTGRKLAACARNPHDPAGLAYSSFVYEIKNGRGMQTMRGLLGHVIQVRFSPDGQMLAALSSDWHVAIWDVASETLVHVLEAPQGLFADNAGFAFSPDNQQFAFATRGAAKLWDAGTGLELQSWTFKEKSLQDQVAFDATGRLLLIRAEKLPRAPRWTIGVYELLGPNPRRLSEPDIGEFDWDVKIVAVPPDGSLFVVDALDGPTDTRRQVTAFDTLTGKLLWPPKPSKLQPTSGAIRFDPSGNAVAVALGDGTTPIFKPRTGQQLGEVTDAHHGCIGRRGTLAISPTDMGCALWHRDSKVRLVTLGIDVPCKGCEVPSFDSTGKYVAWGNADGSVTLCEIDAVQARLKKLGLGW